MRLELEKIDLAIQMNELLNGNNDQHRSDNHRNYLCWNSGYDSDWTYLQASMFEQICLNYKVFTLSMGLMFPLKLEYKLWK